MPRESFLTIKELGQGGFGSAFLVKDKEDGLLYVAKEQRGLQSITVTENEVATLKKLYHPNIIKYYKSWVQDNSTFILMEYANGGNLDEYLAMMKLPLPESRIMEIFSQIVFGLHHIHGQQIIHRDLKPNNIFLHGSDKRIVKIGDFGISKDVPGQIARTVIGTKIYMAPEVIQGQVYDNKCDMWGCGMILYEMAMNRYPFDYSNKVYLLDQIKYGTIQWPSVISLDMRNLITNLLYKDPYSRPGTGTLVTLNRVRMAFNNIFQYFTFEEKKFLCAF